MNFRQHRNIILASGSPRRKEYLERYGIRFEVVKKEVDETNRADENPEDFAVRMAREKAEAVILLVSEENIVIAADTIVVFDHRILGKPRDENDVLPMLAVLNGNSHEVITAYHLFDCRRNTVKERSVSTRVRFNRVRDELLKAYAESEEPLDKAGAYSIQGDGTFLVESISGSYNNVVGLPIEMLIPDLMEMGVLSV